MRPIPIQHALESDTELVDPQPISHSLANPLANPFAACRIRPGALAYRFPPIESLDACLERIVSHRRCQIVGPHGIGKSTLVHTLLTAWIRRGGRADWFRVGPAGALDRIALSAERMSSLLPSERDGQRKVSAEMHLVCVDGWDRLSRWRRLTQLLALRGAYCVITTHHATRWPVLHRPAPTPELLQELADELQSATPISMRVPPATIEACYRRCDGNLRESLFALYDEFEDRR
ncbi:MAG: ATP-binding protein [Planctomycetales bacterium]|nr:ATP-binding protein [Planctomycetales bacterium]